MGVLRAVVVWCGGWLGARNNKNGRCLGIHTAGKSHPPQGPPSGFSPQQQSPHSGFPPFKLLGVRLRPAGADQETRRAGGCMSRRIIPQAAVYRVRCSAGRRSVVSKATTSALHPTHSPRMAKPNFFYFFSIFDHLHHLLSKTTKFHPQASVRPKATLVYLSGAGSAAADGGNRMFILR